MDELQGMFSQDFYDKMMETHHDVKGMVAWSKRHDQLDDERFKDMHKKLYWIAGAVLIVAGASGALPAIVAHFKIGG